MELWLLVVGGGRAGGHRDCPITPPSLLPLPKNVPGRDLEGRSEDLRSHEFGHGDDEG